MNCRHKRLALSDISMLNLLISSGGGRGRSPSTMASVYHAEMSNVSRGEFPCFNMKYMEGIKMRRPQYMTSWMIWGA